MDSCPGYVMQDSEQMADCLIQFHDPKAGECIDMRSSSRDTFANEIASVYNDYLHSVKGNSEQKDPVYMGKFSNAPAQYLALFRVDKPCKHKPIAVFVYMIKGELSTPSIGCRVACDSSDVR